MTNTTAVVASNQTDTIEEGTYTTGHSHCEQLAQHQTSSSTLPSLQATNTSLNKTFTAEPSSVQEINIQSHSRHGNERFASDSNSEYSSSSLSGSTKKCTYNKNSSLVNKSNIAVNKYTKFSERNNQKSSETMVAMPELLSENNNLDDTTEELQYGPGIVSKLRCRYLSLALRQSSSKQRPSLDNLRRATSLNNLIDEEDEQNIGTNRQAWNQERNHSTKEKARTPDEYIPSFNREHNEQNENRCRPNQRGNDSLKRARSVEALMRYDQTAWQRDINKDSIDQTANTMIVLEEITNENTKVNSDVVTIEDKIIQARERGEHKPKRLTSFMDETERPPPDLVKHTLRIFEASANRRPRIGTKGNGGVAAKVANYKTIIMQEKPQIVFPKPPLSPKKPVIKPRTSSPKQVLNGNRYTNGNGVDSNKKIPTIDINVAKSNFENPIVVSPTSNGAKKITDTSRSPSPLSVRVDLTYRTNKFESPVSPQQASRPNSTSQLVYSTSPQSPVLAIPRPMPRQELLRSQSDINAQNQVSADSPMAMLSKKLETLAIESPKNGTSTLNLSDIESDEFDANYSAVVDDSDIDKPSKRISKTALDNISKAGETTEFNFFAQSSKSHLPLNGNCSTPIKTSSCDTNEQNVRQIGIIRPQVKTSVTSPANIPLPKVINTKDNQPVVITESTGMIEEKPNRDKLLITNLTSPGNILLTTREIEQNLINKEKSDEIKWVSKTNTVPISKPWQKQEQNNTMVFNFSNKKDVPDYIEKFENDGLVVRRKRDWTKVSEFSYFFFFFIESLLSAIFINYTCIIERLRRVDAKYQTKVNVKIYVLRFMFYALFC